MFLLLLLLVCSTSVYTMDNNDDIVQGILTVEGTQPDGWSNVSASSISPDEIGTHTPIYNRVRFTFTPLAGGTNLYKFELPLEQARELQEGKKWQYLHEKTILQAIINKQLVDKIRHIQ